MNKKQNKINNLKCDSISFPLQDGDHLLDGARQSSLTEQKEPTLPYQDPIQQRPYAPHVHRVVVVSPRTHDTVESLRRHKHRSSSHGVHVDHVLRSFSFQIVTCVPKVCYLQLEQIIAVELQENILGLQVTVYYAYY